jgi:hypothetical protein
MAKSLFVGVVSLGAVNVPCPAPNPTDNRQSPKWRDPHGCQPFLNRPAKSSTSTSTQIARKERMANFCSSTTQAFAARTPIFSAAVIFSAFKNNFDAA